MKSKELIEKYLEFKKECIALGIFNIDEIGRLFKIYINQFIKSF